MKLTSVLVALLLVSQVLGQAWPNGPVKALYIDDGIDWDNPSATFKQVIDSGYNLLVLAFLVSGQQYDAAAAWDQIGSSGQQSTIAYAHSKGARIIVSAGGDTDLPYSSFTGAAYGTAAAQWAKQRYLDGVDFDLENINLGFTFGSYGTQASIQWVIDATNSARSVLGVGGIITHAPQPPYFGADNGFADGYTQVYKGAPSITFLFVQYYNNGPAATYEDIFVSDNGGAVKELVAGGIPLSKIVIGKPVKKDDADEGYITASTFHSIVQQAQNELGWNTGIMGWQWHSSSVNSKWVSTIYPN
eukprot:Phypoly_transcript_14380.p1 GENE.Phypoly_transcript_14380~~Phypoly_transcript_14380.p1  ORF type:complete len:310 (-),score=55.62 Phypoly_transcript_14380:67-972(-)